MVNLYFFTYEQGNLLIRLIIAHLIADFILQNKTMVTNKSWLSKYMGFHIFIVMLSTFLFTFSWRITFIIALTHWLVDSGKVHIEKKFTISKMNLFMLDQLMHVCIILLVWLVKFNLFKPLLNCLTHLLTNYQLSLLILTYAIVIWPLAYLIRFILQNHEANNNNTINNAGMRIGQFERTIILTFVLLGEYEAIGFLITGKSIIRFADKNSEIKSEYVLVGTMLSYASTILIGIIVNWLLHL